MYKFLQLLIAFLICSGSLQAETIAEKKEALAYKKESGDLLLPDINQALLTLRKELEESYRASALLQSKGAAPEEFKELLCRIQQAKGKISDLEKQWRETAGGEARKEDAGYALWDQEETNLSQLVIEYGSSDYIYVIPPEMAAIKLNLHSSLPIPKESWESVLEIILAHNGIGVKTLNNYARQLYVLKQELSFVTHIMSKPEELAFVPSQARLFYVLSPSPEQVKPVFQFLERFADAKQSFVYQIGNKIALVSAKEEVEKMLSIYNMVWEGNKGKVARVVAVTKMHVKEMEKILSTFFGDSGADRAKPPFAKTDDGLSLFALNQGGGLVLIGSSSVVDRAESLVRETEDQLQDPCEMTVFLYSCRHSDPVELSKVLDKVYESLLFSSAETRDNVDINYTAKNIPPRPPPDGYAPTPPLVVMPQPIKTGSVSQLEVEKGSDHFIPDPKSGTILMVVRRDVLVKLKDLLHKLDIPKRMVQIEVLLFEKQLNTQNSSGMNLLKLGTTRNGAIFEGADAPGRLIDHEHNLPGKGVLEYLLHHGRTDHFPEINLAFSFLMSQEDIQLNASPSVMTVNQTPATITIQEEISINNGAAPIDSNKGIAFEKSFSRAQYGINIVVTPTVHVAEEDEENSKGSITLQTNITFDTPKTSIDDRPPVLRRHIENEVRVEDGQTVIIGGLRKKHSEDSEDRVPLLGEIPFLGKFFGSTKLIDRNTEMFFFITPTIIHDPKEQMDHFRREELKKRPGEIPEYLERLVEAQNKEKKKFFQQGYKMIFGM